MPAKRLSMRKIKDVLRLCWGQGVSKRQVARSCGISRPTVRAYLRRAEAAGLRWPLPAELDDGALERVLFPLCPPVPDTARGAPDWSDVHRELKRPGVTLLLLWEEYRRTHPHGYQYTWFCQQYRAWTGKLDLVMRQTHRAGEKLFVDYAGMRAQVIDPATGAVREAEVFVAVLGASNYTYAEATWTQGLADWIGAHVRCFTYLGGVPEVVVPDNLRAGVAKAHRYEPDINPTYQDLAAHYGVAIIPARVRRPRDNVSKYVKSLHIRKLKSPLNPSIGVTLLFAQEQERTDAQARRLSDDTTETRRRGVYQRHCRGVGGAPEDGESGIETGWGADRETAASPAQHIRSVQAGGRPVVAGGGVECDGDSARVAGTGLWGGSEFNPGVYSSEAAVTGKPGDGAL